MSENRGRNQVKTGKSIIPSITAKPEPELTPMVLGLARELFMTPCRITPAHARPIPAKRPPSTLGSRTVIIRVRTVVSVSLEKRDFMTEDGSINTLPNRMPVKEVRISKRNRISIIKGLFSLINIIPFS